MHLSQSAAVVVIGMLFACANGSAEDRSATSSQRYRIHVPKEVMFGRVEPSAVSEPSDQPAQKDAGSVAFMAETTSGMTIQFDAQPKPSGQPPLKLTLGGRQQGSWRAHAAHDLTRTTHESVAAGTSVQASTLGAGWTTLKIEVVGPSAVSDESLTTIVVTIVAH